VLCLCVTANVHLSDFINENYVSDNDK